jgi:hypothetical protein
MLDLLETMPELQEDERTIVSTRVFNAPRKMVYAAFADPQQVVEWWGRTALPPLCWRWISVPAASGVL